jgi:hypothetical protein
VPAGSAVHTLVIRTLVEDPVVITTIEPTLVERRTISPMAYAVKNAYGCGVLPVRSVWADFDADRVSVTYDDGQGR